MTRRKILIGTCASCNRWVLECDLDPCEAEQSYAQRQLEEYQGIWSVLKG